MITGTSIISAAGIGMDQCWTNFLNQKKNIEERFYKFSSGKEVKFPVYAVQNMKLSDWFDQKDLHFINETGLSEDQDFKMLIVSIKIALTEAAIDTKKNSNISLILAHENPGVANLLNKLLKTDIRNRDEENLFTELQEDFYNIQTFPHLFYLSRLFGIDGPTFTVNNACASGSYALELGRQLIFSKTSEIVVIATSDYAHPTEYLWLQNKGFCSESSIIRPFDQNRDGTILGDGAATVILESVQSASMRYYPTFCEYMGASLYQENWRMTLPDITKNSYTKVITNVMQTNNLNMIDLIIPHGTGSRLWDSYEERQIINAFKNMEGIPLITALKPYVGHTLGASSLLEIVILIESMRQSKILPILDHKNTEKYNLDSFIVKDLINKKMNTVMKTVSAYGGFTAASLFKIV